VDPYDLKILDSAGRALDRLDPALRSRILKRIRWLASNFDAIEPQPLVGEFAGLFKFRVGDYRAIYEIVRGLRTIVIHDVGHRKDIYRP
jgi:mRNA interferase RelE/StbE